MLPLLHSPRLAPPPPCLSTRQLPALLLPPRPTGRCSTCRGVGIPGLRPTPSVPALVNPSPPLPVSKPNSPALCPAVAAAIAAIAAAPAPAAAAPPSAVATTATVCVPLADTTYVPVAIHALSQTSAAATASAATASAATVAAVPAAAVAPLASSLAPSASACPGPPPVRRCPPQLSPKLPPQLAFPLLSIGPFPMPSPARKA
jgi:hypothetical protein